jgi:hypothetical protein
MLSVAIGADGLVTDADTIPGSAMSAMKSDAFRMLVSPWS